MPIPPISLNKLIQHIKARISVFDEFAVNGLMFRIQEAIELMVVNEFPVSPVFLP
jgi:hypothetical protein